MTDRVLSFYESLADHYHQIFDDWDRTIERQAKILNPLLGAQMRRHPLKILDFACGIGTQALGFASFGHRVVASDLSPGAINRARHEAASRGLSISFHVADMTSLSEIGDRDFDVAAVLDNALPHLTAEQLSHAIEAAVSKLKPDGLFIASIRDYDTLIQQRPATLEPAFYGGERDRRIVHQVWDWLDDRRYVVHLYISVRSGQAWTTRHFVSEYRCLLRNELSDVLHANGFRDVQWLMPAESGFYQPVVMGRRV